MNILDLVDLDGYVKELADDVSRLEDDNFELIREVEEHLETIHDFEDFLAGMEDYN